MSPVYIHRRELFDRAWSKPMTTNATELGVKASSLATLARQLNLPLPQAGHWMKKEVGKAPETPVYPEDPALDEQQFPLVLVRDSRPHRLAARTRARASTPIVTDSVGLTPDESSKLDEHPKVAQTRSALSKVQTTERIQVGGRGKFRLLAAPGPGERACAILDRLITAVEAMGWTLDNTEQGYAINADGESAGFSMEEKLDQKPHVITPAELKEKDEYERRCALADRGIGHRPWRAPSIPVHDFTPNGELVLKLDLSPTGSGARRTFSDGKRQRLEDLVPAMIDALQDWAAAVKARREEHERWQREWAEKEQARQKREHQARIEGYRIKFIKRQLERKREIEGLSSLIADWETGETIDPKFAELVDFARLYRTSLEAKIAPAAVAERIAKLRLMDDDIYIYDEKQLD